MRFYSTTEVNEAEERLEELREMEKSKYRNMSHEREFARRIELSVLEAQLNERGQK